MNFSKNIFFKSYNIKNYRVESKASKNVGVAITKPELRDTSGRSRKIL